MTEKLYPDLSENNNEAQDKIQIYNKNIYDQVNKNLSDARIKEIQGKRHELEQSLKHYKKILKRWKKFGNVLKISSLVVLGASGLCGLIGVGLTIGGFVAPIVLGIIAPVGFIEGFLSETFVLGLIKKKKYSRKR